MADWERALDKQLATYLWWHTPASHYVASNWIADVNRKYGGNKTPEGMAIDIRRTLFYADPIYVTPDMCDLLEAAYPTFEPETLREDDLILSDGFALLPRVLYIPDMWGKRTAVRAMAWRMINVDDSYQEADRGLEISLFCNADDRDDYSEQWDIGAMRSMYGDAMALVGTDLYGFGENVVNRIERTLSRRLDVEKIDTDTARRSIVSEVRLLQCFWRLIGQQIAVGIKQRPSRGARRRSEAAKYPEKHVTVVTLRRPRHVPEEPVERKVEWSHRWIVSGHWHTYHYKEGPRQLWVGDYVKGPEDRPLAIRKMRVFRFAR